VENLKWILASPSLLDSSASPYAPSDNWFNKLLKDYENHFLKLKNNPDPLLNFLSTNLKSYRLGDYFEVLWRYWFETNSDYKLLHKNLQVFDARKTIGEFDFIVLNKQSNKIECWEVAVKFYLQKFHDTENYFWYGPRKADRLDKKLDKLINHQILLSSTSPAIDLLHSLNIKVEDKKIILKGRLFHLPNSSNKYSFEHYKKTDKINSKHENSTWYYCSDFINQFDYSKYQWRSLNKINFLSQSGHLNESRYLSSNDIKTIDKPMCIAGIKNNVEKLRYFIVPDDW
jgi:hypothetical protein